MTRVHVHHYHRRSLPWAATVGFAWLMVNMYWVPLILTAAVIFWFYAGLFYLVIRYIPQRKGTRTATRRSVRAFNGWLGQHWLVRF